MYHKRSGKLVFTVGLILNCSAVAPPETLSVLTGENGGKVR
jgi:hypothetical protein